MSAPLGLGSLLRHLTATFDTAVERVYLRAGLDFRPRFYPVFVVLVDRKSATVGELVASIGLTQPALTQTLARMRQAGLVRLVRSADLRERRYALTPRARQQLPALQSIWTAVARAATKLERRLGQPLGATLEAAARELAATPFDRRIERELKK